MRKLTAEQELIVATVRQFVDKEVIPVASAMEHRNEYPHALVDQMRKMGLFGLNVPEEYGGTGIDYTTFAMIFEELARGWLGLAGVDRDSLGAVRRAGSLRNRGTEAAIPARARVGRAARRHLSFGTQRRHGSAKHHYHGDAPRRWLPHQRLEDVGHQRPLWQHVPASRQDRSAAEPAHRGMSAFVIEKGAPGLTVSRDIDKLGYKSVETCELHFQDFPVPAENLIGGVEGHGFKQVMTGLEAERLNVAARGLGIARAAFEEAIRYAQRRTTFGKPIAEHQTIQIKLADMATRIEASRLLIYSAAEKKDRGERCDLEAGMAKLFATETAAEVSFEAMRILGGNGYSKDFPVERYYRDAPLVVIGGGTNELQRLIIARNLLKKYRV